MQENTESTARCVVYKFPPESDHARAGTEENRWAITSTIDLENVQESTDSTARVVYKFPSKSDHSRAGAEENRWAITSTNDLETCRKVQSTARVE